MTNRIPSPPSHQDGTQPIRPVTERQPTVAIPPPPSRSAYPRLEPGQVEKRRSGFYLPAWSIALMLVTVVFVAGAMIGGVMLLGGGIAPEQPPQIIIVTAPPTPTPEGGVTATPAILLPAVVTPGAFPTFALEGPTLPPIVLTPTPRQITIGATVAVTEDNVRLRGGAGINQREIELLRAGMLFRIIGGPQMANAMSWWQVEDLSDPTRTGWVSGLYLTLP